jgi:hypothetical protein
LGQYLNNVREGGMSVLGLNTTGMVSVDNWMLLWCSCLEMIVMH